jgi:hypothetical protein
VVLASKLSEEHIVIKIWIPSFNSLGQRSKKRNFAVLKLLATSVNSAPWLVEIMGKVLRK